MYFLWRWIVLARILLKFESGIGCFLEYLFFSVKIILLIPCDVDEEKT